jgi:hypothetical protein
MLVRACASPTDKTPLALPKRVARARRVMESKRMDSFRTLHDTLKKTAKEEKEFVDSFFKKTQDMWNEVDAADEEEADKEEE